MARRYDLQSRRFYIKWNRWNFTFPKAVSERQFPRATITDIYDHLKPILKRHPEFLILHVGTNGTLKYTSNERVDKVLALKRFIASQNKSAKSLFQH